MMDRRSFLSAAALGIAAGAVPVASAQDDPGVDPALSPYETAQGISGTLISNGSDSMSTLMSYWAQGFKNFYPGDKVQIESKGSNTAFPSLITGTAQLGPMSRPAKKSEEEAFEAKFGYKASQIRTAVDTVAVIVNKDNPLKSISLEQIDAVYSKGRRRGVLKQAASWGDLGLGGEWAGKPISLYGRNAASGTYVYVKEHVLQNGDYRDDVKELPGTSSVAQAVSVDRYGIGYVGIGYVTSSVKALSIAEREGSTPVEPTEKNAYSGDYPLSRFLYLYFNRTPGRGMEPLVREFIRYVCSRDGQNQVVKAGYHPIPASITAEEMKKVE
jgi:phosphate transport system substrate-binding protein